jgi:hypothetical protein
MSHNLYTGIAKFVMSCYLEGEDDYEDEDMLKLSSPECWQDEFCETEEMREEPVVSFGGWTYSFTEDKSYLKKDNGVLGDCWTKGDTFKVWLVNEDRASNCGCHNMALCSSRKEDIEEFVKDHLSHIIPRKFCKIEEEQVITSWC